MAPDIEEIVEGILKREGVYSHDVLDMGGETKYGISQKAFPTLDIKSLTIAHAKDIYRQKYIIGPKIHLLPEMLRPIMADFAVNSGPHVAIQKLQKVLGVKEDGVIGSKTLEAVAKRSEDLRSVVNGVVEERVLMLGRIVVQAPKQLKFLVGWLKRALSFLR